MTSETNKIIPDEYQDYIYRFTYWVLAKIAPYIPRAITPNQITIAAFISAMIGTILLYIVQSPAAFLYWIGFNLLWYVLDALDGIHARLTQQSSEFGGFLDHALDDIYFLFMLTVFALKFDLLGHGLYIFILLLRTTAAIIVFIVQVHTKKLYLGKFSAGLELPLFTLVMILSYCFPNFNPLIHTDNQMLINWIHYLSLEKGMFMKLVLCIYLIGAPINMLLQFQFVKKHCKN